MSNLFGLFTGIANPMRAVWVTTKTGNTFRGLLVEQRRDFMTLRNASLGTVDAQRGEVWTKMQGDVVIAMDNVDYWQDALPVSALE